MFRSYFEIIQLLTLHFRDTRHVSSLIKDLQRIRQKPNFTVNISKWNTSQKCWNAHKIQKSNGSTTKKNKTNSTTETMSQNSLLTGFKQRIVYILRASNPNSKKTDLSTDCNPETNKCSNCGGSRQNSVWVDKKASINNSMFPVQLITISKDSIQTTFQNQNRLQNNNFPHNFQINNSQNYNLQPRPYFQQRNNNSPISQAKFKRPSVIQNNPNTQNPLK